MRAWREQPHPRVFGVRCGARGRTDGMTTEQHDVAVKGRKWMSVTGVASVESCDTHEITLVTRGGPLQIQGSNLHMQRLDLENGVVEVEGTLMGMSYVADKKRKTSLLRRVVR